MNILKLLAKLVGGLGSRQFVSRHWNAVELSLCKQFPDLTDRERAIARAACERLIDHVV